MSNDYYQILQVHLLADQEVIQAAYKRLARKYHPDKSEFPDAALRMRELNAAYEILSDPIKRLQYDQERLWHGEKQAEADAGNWDRGTRESRNWQQGEQGPSSWSNTPETDQSDNHNSARVLAWGCFAVVALFLIVSVIGTVAYLVMGGWRNYQSRSPGVSNANAQRSDSYNSNSNRRTELDAAANVISDSANRVAFNVNANTASNSTANTAKTPANSAPADELRRDAFVLGDLQPVYEAMNPTARIVEELEENDDVEVNARPYLNGRWYKVTTMSGQSGYMLGKSIRCYRETQFRCEGYR